MEDEDDRAEWLAAAAASAAVVAHELICLRSPWKRVPWRRLLRPPADDAPSPAEILSEEIGVPTTELAPPPGWTVRAPRTGKGAAVRGPSKSELEEEKAAARGSARASPATPLDYSAGSGSGGEEGSSGAADGPATRPPPRPSELRGGTKVGPLPAALRVGAARPVRRPGKKKTMPELQAVEKSLLEERRLLQEEVESGRRVQQALMEENQRLKRLKLTLQSNSAPLIAVYKERESKEHQMPACNILVPLPDLNEPCPEDLN